MQAKRNQQIALVQAQGVPILTTEILPLLLAPESYDTMPELVDALEQISNSTSAAGVVNSLQAMRDRTAALPWLHGIAVPTLIIHGQQDQLIPLTEAETMHQHIPNAELYAVPAAGHMPNLEQPELFNDLVAEFLESL
jgi:pimeloyl-ACP methyl ester carboxylesterase